ncbi:MAG: restriction endonuclease subunit S [Ruminococcus sp.]|nr:restriction endonuclease subunit S [Ruminococcus sp.]
MSNWQTVKLSDIFTLQMGKTPSRDNSAYWNGTHNWVSIADLSKTTKYIVSTKESITDLAVSETGIKATPKDTVVMSFKLSIGKTAVTAEETYTNEAIMSFIDKGVYDVDIDYIFHLFSGKDWSKGTNKAVMGVTLNKATLSQISIPLPPLETQKQIAANLDKVTHTIDLCNNILEKLDLLVKSRFVEMFGDVLKNDKKWIERPLGEICEKIVRYPTFYGMDYIESGTRVIRIGNILNDGHMETDDENYVFVYEGVNDDFPETVVEENDIIMAVRGDGSAAKRIGFITENCLVGANISPNLIRIKANSSYVIPIFLFYYLTGEIGQKRLDAYVNKTAKKNIAAKDIVKVISPVPPLALQEQFAAFVEQTDKSKSAVKQVLEKAETLKKALMQEYFG